MLLPRRGVSAAWRGGNPKLPTVSELLVTDVRVWNTAVTPPFPSRMRLVSTKRCGYVIAFMTCRRPHATAPGTRHHLLQSVRADLYGGRVVRD